MTDKRKYETMLKKFNQDNIIYLQECHSKNMMQSFYEYLE